MKKEELLKNAEEIKINVGCLCCPGTSVIRETDTVLYFGFGGWSIEKDGQHYYSADPSVELEWEEYKTLSEIEEEAKLSPKSLWIAELDLPLRSAKYQRSECGKWILIKSGQGFA